MKHDFLLVSHAGLPRSHALSFHRSIVGTLAWTLFPRSHAPAWERRLDAPASIPQASILSEDARASRKCVPTRERGNEIEITRESVGTRSPRPPRSNEIKRDQTRSSSLEA